MRAALIGHAPSVQQGHAGAGVGIGHDQEGVAILPVAFGARAQAHQAQPVKRHFMRLAHAQRGPGLAGGAAQGETQSDFGHGISPRFGAVAGAAGGPGGAPLLQVEHGAPEPFGPGGAGRLQRSAEGGRGSGVALRDAVAQQRGHGGQIRCGIQFDGAGGRA